METNWIDLLNIEDLINDLLEKYMKFLTFDELFLKTKEFKIYQSNIDEINDIENFYNDENADKYYFLTRNNLSIDTLGVKESLIKKNTLFFVDKNISGVRKINNNSRSMKLINLKNILSVKPMKIEFKNYELNKEYKSRIIIKNISNNVARYGFKKCLDKSFFLMELSTAKGIFERENLAPGMHAILTIKFKTNKVNNFIEGLILNVENGKSIIIKLFAFREPPQLTDNIEFPINNHLFNQKDDEKLDLKLEKNVSRADTTIFDELDCKMCFIGEEIHVKLRLINYGGPGNFQLISEDDWYSKENNDIFDENELILSCFKINPTNFDIKKNQSVILNAKFTPVLSGFHGEKFLIICENKKIKEFEILGDGIFFNSNFIYFENNLSDNLSNDENENFEDLKIVFLNDQNLVSFTLSNTSEIDIFYHWKIKENMKNKFLKIQPEFGVFPGLSKITFEIEIFREYSPETKNLTLQYYFAKMADLEAVLADVSYLMAMEKSKCTPAARASKKIVLPDPSVRSVMHKYLEKKNEVNFDKIFHQMLGYLLFKDFCETVAEEPIPQLRFYEEVKSYEKLECPEERRKLAREIYDNFIMKELLAHSHEYSTDAVSHVHKYLMKNEVPVNLFEPYIEEIFNHLRGEPFRKFLESEKYTRFCQWKNLELNIQLTMNDFSVHRIIGRGGFGEVYGCRKADTGKMYAMKCLDKKRIKMKQGETLALNERIMLSLVSTGVDCPFIVCMTYAFHTPDKLCFILDLMNGGDLHYHLSQHGVFNEPEMKFYAAEVILGLEHMHRRYIVYRDLKPANILLDEHGHVRISDLGLACDFSKKKPHASVGTHGYMAPEVLSKGTAYDSSADWFSFGCMLYKLLKGHSPFRQHKTKDKHEIDRMTLTMNVELPESFSRELRLLLENLLQRDINNRLGCRGGGADELKEHPFFSGIDWQQVYLQKYTPPLIPPRGEVNAADAFDIGSFDEEDTKGIKLTDADQDLYKNFPLVISERWQGEVAETVFETINNEADKMENKKKAKQKSRFDADEKGSDCILHGYIKKLGGPFASAWQTRYAKLYPNRLELHPESATKTELVFLDQVEEVGADLQHVKGEQCIVVRTRDAKIVLTNPDEISLKEWALSLRSAHKNSTEMLGNMAIKAGKIYGTEREAVIPPIQRSTNGN
ncbi:hypothetical protein HCN44_004591 [Aphidius gifuensis]|uniref:[G-protein-coupled receptor] kinase n=5 Tax=Pterygota TaxID=7496 RepID=A0A835CTJ2_APHGI|nr:hypothetical protein HCN44_004591 [Aphidius gifuensis]